MILKFLGCDPRPRKDDLAGQLRDARQALGITQRQLAARLKVDPATIWKWEQSRQRPPVKYWPRLIEVVGEKCLPVGAAISGRLLAYRRARGLTQAEFGALLGVSQNAVSAWELGRSKPSSQGLEVTSRLRRLVTPTLKD